jgi:hypothetical protein
MIWLGFLQSFLVALTIFTAIGIFFLIRVIWPRK